MFAAATMRPRTVVRSLFCSSSSRTQKSRRHLLKRAICADSVLQRHPNLGGRIRTMKHTNINVTDLMQQTQATDLQLDTPWMSHWRKNSLRFLQKQLKQLRPSGPIPTTRMGIQGKGYGWWFCPIIQKGLGYNPRWFHQRMCYLLIYLP